MVAKGASHCGAGCTLGDIVAEWAAFALPGIAVAFGWGSLFSQKLFAVWILDYILAFLFGFGFQYFTIKPASGAIAKVDTAEFWFAMQLAMLAGFATSYPANWLLPKLGVKERM